MAEGLKAEPLGLRRCLLGKLLLSLWVKVKPQPRRAGWSRPRSTQLPAEPPGRRLPGENRGNWALIPIYAPNPSRSQ